MTVTEESLRPVPEAIASRWTVLHRDDCAGIDLGLVAVICNSGVVQPKVFCHGCSHVSGAISKSALVAELIVECDLPVLRDHRDGTPCERCGSLDGVELHHWAPRGVFGMDEAERWPTGWLCPKCHNLWHIHMAKAQLRS